MHNWQIINNYRFDQEKKTALKSFIISLLKNRGITGKGNIANFLRPDLKNITPENLNISQKEMTKASERLKKAIHNRESIVVYTDYDVDGIVAGAIIWEILFKMGAKIMPFVPNRITEGYGLSKTGLDKIREKFNPSLIITVDHGISASKEVSYARKFAIDIIIIDHHLPAKSPPKPFALIHTTQLSAAGLAWVFTNFLTGRLLEKYLDLVALATVADMVPLLNENRILVTFGLKEINKTRRVGLNSLMKASGVIKGQIDSHTLGHILAPRLNASGRLEEGIDSLRLLCTKDRQRASDLAQKLNNVNRHRQALTKNSLDLAHSIIKETSNLVFVHSDTFHQGVIGLIAGKLVETYHRPAIVVSVGSEFCKASARSVKGINIVEFLHSASELLIDVGGHPMAAGFTVNKKNLQKLKQKLLSNTDKLIGSIPHVPVSLADLELDPALVDDKLFAEISALAPFGQANPKPAFAAFALKVRQARVLGRDKNHLKLELSSKNNPEKIISAIAFNFGNLFSSLGFDSSLDMIYEIDKDNWNGQSGLILKLRDVRLAA